jgi:hypothetical protein
VQDSIYSNDLGFDPVEDDMLFGGKRAKARAQVFSRFADFGEHRDFAEDTIDRSLINSSLIAPPLFPGVQQEIGEVLLCAW